VGAGGGYPLTQGDGHSDIYNAKPDLRGSRKLFTFLSGNDIFWHIPKRDFERISHPSGRVWLPVGQLLWGHCCNEFTGGSGTCLHGPHSLLARV